MIVCGPRSTHRRPAYSYQLGATGNRTGATEQTGRTLTWNYDGIYRLTSEAVGADPSGGNGEVDYTLDPVGNRTSVNSSLPGVQSVTLEIGRAHV